MRLILLTTASVRGSSATLGPRSSARRSTTGSCRVGEETLKWAGLLLLVTLIGALFGIVMHTLIVRSWLIALYGTMKMVTRKVAQMGHVLPVVRRRARCSASPPPTPTSSAP